MDLKDLRRNIGESCISCNKCVDQCLFLQRYGLPKDIADNDNFDKTLAFECSLCGLCEAICPESLKVPLLHHSFRKEALSNDQNILKKYKRLLTYESFGASNLLRLYKFPKGCDTALFPGCEFPHTRPHLTEKLFVHLKNKYNNIGLILDCCFKPSYDLGRESFAMDKMNKLEATLVANGIKNIITVCSSCYIHLSEHLKGINVKFIYDYMEPLSNETAIYNKMHLIDPCSVRFEQGIHDKVRDILKGSGVGVKEHKYEGATTLCCGEGGATGFVTDIYKEAWVNKMDNDITKEVITYCAGCTNVKRKVRSLHLMDILLENKKSNLKHNIFGYLKRFFMKLRLSRLVD